MSSHINSVRHKLKIANKTLSEFAALIFAVVGYVAASSVSAQEIPIRVVPSSLTPIPYLSTGLTVYGLRKRFELNYNLIPYGLSINGSRIVATILMGVDERTPKDTNTEGVFANLSPGTYTVEVVERGATVPERRSAPVTITVPSPAQASVPVFSVFDRKILKFFLTVNASDVAALVASNKVGTGPEWMPVEENIRVWTTPQPFTVPVCRFYVPAAAVHFFSAYPSDSTKLRGLAGFTDEGTAFHVIPSYREPDLVDSGGPYGKLINVCPTGTDPVYRLFDDTPGHAAHRYSTNPDATHDFLTTTGSPSGYRMEGVVFCSPRE